MLIARIISMTAVLPDTSTMFMNNLVITLDGIRRASVDRTLSPFRNALR